MELDAIVLQQGIVNALSDDAISKNLYHKLNNVINNTSYAGPSNRKVCDYHSCMMGISTIDQNPVEISRLWEYLGKSISSAIVVSYNMSDKEL